MKNSFKNLSYPELKAKRDELSRKYMDFRFQMVIGHVDNPLQKRQLRRQIARLNTLIRQHEIAQEREQQQAQMQAQVRTAPVSAPLAAKA